MSYKNEEIRSFGTVIFTHHAQSYAELIRDGSKLIFEKSEIYLHGLVPIHTHRGGLYNRPFSETYILKADEHNHDVRLVTIANGHWEDMTEKDLRDLLARQTPMVPGIPYNCGVGLAHAIINMKNTANDTECLPVVLSTKYYNSL